MIPQIIFYKNVEYINIYTFNFVLKNDILLKSFWNKFNDTYKLQVIDNDHFEILYSTFQKSISLEKLPKFMVSLSSIDYYNNDLYMTDDNDNKLDYDKLFYISSDMLEYVFTNNNISFK